mmetsp:Transcript_146992/g.256647  ORF Transcript_146992/g.256647 Transcript_146992/m.256647 type:complete len:236 (-) Transcript_146992:977-1684(-)
MVNLVITYVRERRFRLTAEAAEVVSLMHACTSFTLCTLVIFKGEAPFWEFPGKDNNLTPFANRVNDISTGYFMYDTVMEVLTAGTFVVHHLNSLAAPAFVMLTGTSSINNCYNLWFAELGGIVYQIYVNTSRDLLRYTLFVIIYAMTRVAWGIFIIIAIGWYCLLPKPVFYKAYMVTGHCGIMFINAMFLWKHFRKLRNKYEQVKSLEVEDKWALSAERNAKAYGTKEPVSPPSP